jgi:hypothetical protein
VTLHTYVDTWAHQGFSGIESDYNKVTHLEAEDCTREDWLERFERYTAHLIDRLQSDVLTRALPLGHGAALTYPDLPWAKWHYVNGKGETVRRDNLPQFVTAADMACRVVQAWAANAVDFVSQPGLPAAAKTALQQLLATNIDMDELKRLDVIRDAVAAGSIPGIQERIPDYIAKGVGSWKQIATGIKAKDDGKVQPKWTRAFETSDYRRFHDAVKEHRFAVVQEILPSRGLRLA